MEIIHLPAQASDIAPPPVGKIHFGPNQPGATSLRDARPLYVDGQHVTAELYQGQITIFVGCKILFSGPLPDGVERAGIMAWVAQRAMASASENEIRVVIGARAARISPDLSDWVATEQSESFERCSIWRSDCSGGDTVFTLRERESGRAIMLAGDLELITMVAEFIDEQAMILGGDLEDLACDLACVVLPYMQTLMPGKTIKAMDWDLARGIKVG